jgi:tetratricopeptide (TPR) repeat protein
MAWHEIARTAIEIQAVAGVSDKPDIVARARSTADTATANIHSVEPEGSTPKLRLAENLEALAGQEVHTSHYDYAVALYHRAIDLRDEVRANDSKNAECHCHVASDYYEIGMIQQAHGKVDDALVAFERAAMIFEDLAHLSPKQQWDHNLAVTYGDLADLFGEKRKEPLSALLYAQKAADIAKTYAEGQTADLQTRIRYATSLERVSDYAWHSAKATTADDPETADRYFRLAIQKRIEANAKRKSVFTADRKNTGYSALATNARRIVGIYLS